MGNVAWDPASVGQKPRADGENIRGTCKPVTANEEQEWLPAKITIPGGDKDVKLVDELGHGGKCLEQKVERAKT